MSTVPFSLVRVANHGGEEDVAEAFFAYDNQIRTINNEYSRVGHACRLVTSYGDGRRLCSLFVHSEVAQLLHPCQVCGNVAYA